MKVLEGSIPVRHLRCFSLIAVFMLCAPVQAAPTTLVQCYSDASESVSFTAGVGTSDGGYAVVGLRKSDLICAHFDASGKTEWQDLYSIPGGIERPLVTARQNGDLLIAARSGKRIYLLFLHKTGAVLGEVRLGRAGGGITLFDAAPSTRGGLYLCGLIEESGDHRYPFLAEVDSAGSVLWSRWFDLDWSIPRSITTSSAGDIIIAGDSSGGAGWLAKFDSRGKMIWSELLVGTYYSVLEDVAASPDGGCYVVGRAKFASGAASDAWFSKVDANGYLVWIKKYGGPDVEEARSVIPNPEGGFFVSGTTMSLQGGCESASDVWYLHLDDSGTVQKQLAFGRMMDDQVGLAALSSGNLALVGHTSDQGLSGDSKQSGLVARLSANGSICGDLKRATAGRLSLTATSFVLQDEPLRAKTLRLLKSSVRSKRTPVELDTWDPCRQDEGLVNRNDDGAASDPDAWAKTVGGAYSDALTSLVPRADGTFAAGGSTDSVGVGAGPHKVLPHAMGFGKNGALLWHRAYTIEPDDAGTQLTGMAATPGGEIALAGWSSRIAAERFYSYGWLLMLDVEGRPLRQWSYYDAIWGGETFITSITPTSDAGFVLTGFYWPDEWSPSQSFAMKTDAVGRQVWAKSYDGAYYTASATSDGGFLLAGSIARIGGDIFLLKANASGNVLWRKIYSGSGTEYVDSIRETDDHGALITGISTGERRAIYVMKVDTNGSIQWQRAFESEDVSSGNRRGERATSNVRATEITGIRVAPTLPGESGYFLCGTSVVLSGGCGGDQDAWLMKLDSSGNPLWRRALGGLQDDIPGAIARGGDGGMIIAGTTSSFGAGLTDAFIARTGSDGKACATITIESPLPRPLGDWTLVAFDSSVSTAEIFLASQAVQPAQSIDLKMKAVDLCDPAE